MKSVTSKLFWDKGKPKKRGFALILALLLSYMLKKKVYDRLVPSSEVMGLIMNQDVKKVLFGSLFLLCQLKNPKGGTSYVLSSRSLINTEELIKTLRQTNTTFSSPLINESHVGWVIVLCVYSFLFIKMINQMRDMHGYKGKQNKDLADS